MKIRETLLKIHQENFKDYISKTVREAGEFG